MQTETGVQCTFVHCWHPWRHYHTSVRTCKIINEVSHTPKIILKGITTRILNRHFNTFW
jgi:hypothetical protein